MKSIVFLVLTAITLSVSNVRLAAHHSYAEFQDHTTSVSGSIVAVLFGEPHTILTLRAADGALYRATWNAAFQLTTMGVTSADLKAGDFVVITGFPQRDPQTHEMAKLQEVRRPSDGWTWKMENGRATLTRSH